MELNVLENKPDRLKIEVVGQSHTLMNILSEKSWDHGALQSSYIIEHPYLAHPKIVVRGQNPKATLEKAARDVAKQAKEFESEFKKALK